MPAGKKGTFTMAGTTYSKFFWQDWASDTALILCSPGAQALWARLLCIASEADPIGHVLLASGEPPTLQELVDITRFPAEAIPGWMDELKARRVCDVGRNGVMISRRMVRDERKRRRNANGGQKTAASTTRNEKGIFTGRTEAHQVPAPATIYQSPSTINHQPAVGGVEKVVSKVARLGEALGFDPTTRRDGHRWITDLVRLEQDGFDLELDILAVVRDFRAAAKIPNDIGSLSYFRRAITAHKEARLAQAAVTEERANAPFEDTTEKGWGARMRGWVDSGFWPPQYGPRPHAGECRAPKHLVAPALATWDEQGGHPAGSFPVDPMGTWTPWHQLRDLRNDPNVDYGNRQLAGADVIPIRRPA